MQFTSTNAGFVNTLDFGANYHMDLGHIYKELRHWAQVSSSGCSARIPPQKTKLFSLSLELQGRLRRGQGELVSSFTPPDWEKAGPTTIRKADLTGKQSDGAQDPRYLSPSMIGEEMTFPQKAPLLAARIQAHMSTDILSCNLHSCPWLNWDRISCLISQQAILRNSRVVCEFASGSWL